MSAKILIIEDDPSLQRALRDNLEHSGYEVQSSLDGLLGIERVTSFSPDLILLDIMLPNLNGFALCKRVREVDLSTPIIMLTAKGEEEDVLLGLNVGANDYLTKPFRIKELLARIKVHLRPYYSKASEQAFVSLANKKWYTYSQKLCDQSGEEVSLTPKEKKLLKLFLDHPNTIFSRQQILDVVWGYTFMSGGRNVDRCVTSLRKKIEPLPAEPKYLITLRGVGYRMNLS
ncbi:MAG: response regulator transcription factor [Akkermansiaceae bacterium]